MARRDYLPTEDRIRFDSPPQLNSMQRLIFADMPAWAQTYLAAVHTSTNKVGFVLQLGYFRIVTRFFIPDRFPEADLQAVCWQLQVNLDDVRMTEYTYNRTLYRHRAIILTQLGYEAFADSHRLNLSQEARRLTHLQTRPALMLDTLVDGLRERRIEIPPYNGCFCRIVHKSSPCNYLRM